MEVSLAFLWECLWFGSWIDRFDGDGSEVVAHCQREIFSSSWDADEVVCFAVHSMSTLR
jgi:hypothetical protein